MTEKLVEVLSRAPADVLKSLLGQNTTSLLGLVAPGANSQLGLAELVVSQYSAAGCVNSQNVRSTIVAQLTGDEAKSLCRLLVLPVSDPFNTLNGVVFGPGSANSSTFFRYFNVDYNPEEATSSEASRRAEPRHKLRPNQFNGYRQLRDQISSAAAEIIVSMPFGSGKLRLITTALLDMFRSASDGQVIVWFAHGEQLCEDVFEEILSTWEEIGSRDITLFRLYGNLSLPDLSNLRNGILVIDIEKFTAGKGSRVTELRTLGKTARAVVIHDVAYLTYEPYRKLLASMSEERSFSLVAICAASRAYLQTDELVTALSSVVGSQPYHLLSDDEPTGLLERGGYATPLTLRILQAPKKLASDEAGKGFDPLDTTDSILAADSERNAWLIDLIKAEALNSEKVVFIANTPEQARMFVGILALKGEKAMAVTSDMSKEQRSQEVGRFYSGEDIKVLCIHGVFVSSPMAANVEAAIIASPTISPMLHSQIVGRLANGQTSEYAKVLKVTAIDDGIANRCDLTRFTFDWSEKGDGL